MAYQPNAEPPLNLPALEPTLAESPAAPIDGPGLSRLIVTDLNVPEGAEGRYTAVLLSDQDLDDMRQLAEDPSDATYTYRENGEFRFTVNVTSAKDAKPFLLSENSPFRASGTTEKEALGRAVGQVVKLTFPFMELRLQ